MKHRKGLLLVNMGGPADLDGVEPFLREIFKDPFILQMPGIFRSLLGNFIVRRRLSKVIDRYRQIGEGSPILRWTEFLTDELKRLLIADGRDDIEVAYSFRYSEPFIDKTIAQFETQGIKELVLLPMFPHYARAMTGSIEVAVKEETRKRSMSMTEVEEWGLAEGIINLQRQYLHDALKKAGDKARVLFVAHGIPLYDVRKGDTYPQQVEKTAAELGASLPKGVEWRLSYSSRLGPVKWTGPYIEEVLGKLTQSKDPLIIMPLSFVADCLETLYDLDIEAASTAENAGIENVVRIHAYNDDPRFAVALYNILKDSRYV